jgi:hypothetical protein
VLKVILTPPISGPPSTSTIPIDCWNISKDTTGGEIHIAANDGGVIKKLQLQLDGPGANIVTSVFGCIGDVLAEPADYSTVNSSVNLGVNAGLLETENNYNFALGNNAALAMTTGGYSANIAYGSGAAITTGLTNTNVGAQAAGWTAATGNSNIVIGNSDASFAQVDVPAADTSNYLNIGNVILGDMAAPGSITISADPIVPLGIATKQYVDANAGQLPRINMTPTYNVATTGNDTTGDGSVGAPFATIVHASQVAAGFDYQNLYFPTIKIANGTYLELVSVPLFTNLGGQGLNGSNLYDGINIMGDIVSTGGTAPLDSSPKDV